MNTLKFGNGEWYGKEGTILAYNDENYNYKPLPFNFERDSKATVINKDGLIETVGSDVPRIDYKDSAEGALLLEPQRTNLVTYSEDFSQWFKIGGATLTSNYSVSPDGTQNSSRMQMNVSDKFYINVALNGDISFAVYLKGVGQIRLRDNTSTGLKDVTLTSEWVRYELNFNATISNFQIEQQTGVSDFEIFGAQLEEGSYATSYIPTQGSIVTRNQDVCSQTVPSGIIGQTEGTMYFQTNKLFSSGTRSIALAYTSGSSYYQIYLTSSNQIRVDVNGSLLVITSAINLNILNKIAFAYKSGENILYVNGVELASSTSTTIPTSLNDFYLGNSLGNEQSGSYQDFKLYNTRLSNTELQALTT